MAAAPHRRRSPDHGRKIRAGPSPYVVGGPGLTECHSTSYPTLGVAALRAVRRPSRTSTPQNILLEPGLFYKAHAALASRLSMSRIIATS